MRRERTLLPGDVARETLGDLKIRVFHAHEIFTDRARRERSRVVKEEVDVSFRVLVKGMLARRELLRITVSKIFDLALYG